MAPPLTAGDAINVYLTNDVLFHPAAIHHPQLITLLAPLATLLHWPQSIKTILP